MYLAQAISLITIIFSPLLSFAQQSGELGIRPYHYLSSVRDQGNSTQSPVTFFLDVSQYGISETHKKWSAGVNTQAVYTLNDRRDWYFEVPELYLGYRPSEESGFFFGRKTEGWSLADQYWSTGLWQPRSRWDYLESKQVGLLGLFSQIRLTQTIGLRVFISPFYVPERGPSFELKNDYISSTNAWFTPVPDSVAFLGKNVPILYQVDLPSTKDIVLNPSFATQLRVGSVKKGEYAQLSYAYKPMNSLLFHYKGFFDISNPLRHTAPVQLSPQVHYHQIATIEGQYTVDQIYGFFGSVSYDLPIDKDMGSEWTRQVYDPAWIFTPTLFVRPQDGLFHRSKFSLSGLFLVGGEVNDTGSQKFGISSGSAFESKFNFKNAIKFAFDQDFSEVFPFKNYFSTSYLYDFYMQGAIFSATWSALFYEDHWKLFMGVDILGSRKSKQDVGASLPSFLSRYQANDRVYGGVSYVY